MNKSQPIVVLITVPTREVGEQIAQKLLEGKLAACVNIIAGVSSLYSWGGDICNDEELLLIVKSRAELFDGHLTPAVQELHPYEIPEIIALPVLSGLRSYLEWIEETTNKDLG